MKVKFFITPVYPYGNDNYYHEIIVLAEGFKELGFDIFGNFDYWQDFGNKEFLIKRRDSDNYDIAIYDYRYVKSFEHLLFRNEYPNFKLDKINILVDRNDWISPIWNNNIHYKIFDLILGCHTVTGFLKPENYFPWSMGLSKRMINSIDKYRNLALKNEIGYNFRVWHNLRELFINKIKSFESNFKLRELITSTPDTDISSEEFFYYRNTTRRHHNQYYKYINSHILFLGFGGYLETLPKFYQPYSFFQKLIRKPFHILSNFEKQKYSFVFQWDSFRMWELFYANTCPILLNFEKFKFELPVLPKCGEHYLSLENFNWDDINQKLNSLSKNEIAEIGRNGKNWVIKNYSPLSTATRLMELV
tara:strand:+ start:200 stop:1282 length:1083 start_codon:yes stop_codon:yes gene_type:complete